MLIFLHGGLGFWDEIILFGGLAVLVIGLMLLPRLSAKMRRKKKPTDDQPEN